MLFPISKRAEEELYNKPMITGDPEKEINWIKDVVNSLLDRVRKLEDKVYELEPNESTYED